MKQRADRYVIGVTGNIGAGKSTVTRALAALGAVVLDADRMARAMQAPGSEAVLAIARTFGDEFAPDGVLDRKALGALVFSDPVAKKALDALMWPRLVAQTKQALANTQGVCILDAPLLIEAGLEALCDEVWLVTAPEEERCRRIMRRDGSTEQEAWRRIRSQEPEDEKRRYATYVLDSTKGEPALIKKAQALYRRACGGNR